DADGKVGIGKVPDSVLTLEQQEDSKGLEIWGFDDRNGYYGKLYIDAGGYFHISHNRATYIDYAGSTRVLIGNTQMNVRRDNYPLTFGADQDYGIGYYLTDDSLQFVDGGTLGANVRMVIANTGNVGIGTTDPHSKLEVNGAISSATDSISASVDSKNVAGINTLFIDASGADDIELGGLSAGVIGQVLHIVITDLNKKVIFEVATGTQPFITHTTINESIDSGGVTFVCDGTNWYDCSHAKGRIQA
ncbi:unnamed protein product, partial [marine sediment metagenome]